MKSKPWYLSKSAWIHGLTVAGGVVAVASNLPLPAKAAAIGAGASGVIGLALRLLTGTPIAGSPADTQP